MPNDSQRFTRRKFLRSTALTAIASASGVIAAPSVLRAQGGAVKIGFLQPVSGALAYSGQQGRLGASIAIEEINAAGGIKDVGKIEAVLGDAQSTPEGGNAEVEKMNSAGVSAIVGGYGSSICLATSQTAARYDLPYLVDVGVTDAIVTRGLKNTFRFGPGFGVIAKTALANLVAINEAAGKPAKTVMIVHEDLAFGSGLAKLLNEQLPLNGFQILETIPHPTPTRDFNNVVLKIRAADPDIVIPANYYNEYVLLARTMQQQQVRPKAAIYSVLGGAASSYKFVKEFPASCAVHHGLQSLVRPAQRQGTSPQEQGRGEGAVLHLRGLPQLQLHAVDGGRRRAREIDRSRQDHRGAFDLNLCRTRDALRSDQICQRPEPGRGADQHASDRQRYPGGAAGSICVGKGGLPDAASIRPRFRLYEVFDRTPLVQLSILFPAIVNGILNGALYALVALGLTLVYGVLHIINFAHGTLLTAALFAAFYLYHFLGIDPYIALVVLTPAFFLVGYALQRLVIGPLSHGDDSNILLVTLGLAVIIENGLLFAFRGDTRTVDLPYSFAVVPFAGMFISVPRLVGFGGAVAVAVLLWLLLTLTDTGKAIRAVAKEKLGAQLSGIDVAHIYALTFGLGTACVAVAACLLIPTYYVNPHVGNAYVLVAFTTVVLGGMGSIPGALIGGLFVGLIESLCGLYLGELLGQIGIFLMFILVLLFRPSGLLGARA